MEAAARDAVQGNILFREEGSDSRHPAEGQFHFLFALLSLSVLLKIYCFIRNVEWKRERQRELPIWWLCRCPQQSELCHAETRFHLDHHLLPLRCISRKLNRKQSSRRSNQPSVVGCRRPTQGQDPPLIITSCVTLLWLNTLWCISEILKSVYYYITFISSKTYPTF